MRQIVKIAQATHHRSSKLTQYASDLRVRCGNVAIAAIQHLYAITCTDRQGWDRMHRQQPARAS